MVVSNAIKLDDNKVDILITLSCFEDKDMKSSLSTTKSSSSSITSDYEKGDGVLIESRTWVFSAVYNKQIQTTIDNIGGVVRFLDNVVSPHSDKDPDSTLELELILMNSSGIYKSIIYPQFKYRIPKSIMNWCNVDYKSYKEFLFPPTVYLDIKKLFQDEPSQKVDVYNLHTGDLEISLHKRVPIIKASALSSSNTDESIFSLSQY
ncbi:16381_t:CDS:2, partial [Entrophospora sp. SA101]